MKYIYRAITPAIERGVRFFPVSVVTGPRQSGKSTLCNRLFPSFTKYNLEDCGLQDRIEDDPKGFINECGERVLIAALFALFFSHVATATLLHHKTKITQSYASPALTNIRELTERF